jgi:hypothetical protein
MIQWWRRLSTIFSPVGDDDPLFFDDPVVAKAFNDIAKTAGAAAEPDAARNGVAGAAGESVHSPPNQRIHLTASARYAQLAGR